MDVRSNPATKGENSYIILPLTKAALCSPNLSICLPKRFTTCSFVYSFIICSDGNILMLEYSMAKKQKSSGPLAYLEEHLKERIRDPQSLLVAVC